MEEESKALTVPETNAERVLWDKAVSVFWEDIRNKVVSTNAQQAQQAQQKTGISGIAESFGKGIGSGMGVDRMVDASNEFNDRLWFLAGYCLQKINDFHEDLYDINAFWDGKIIVAGAQFVIVLSAVYAFAKFFRDLDGILQFGARVATVVTLAFKFIKGSFFLAGTLLRMIYNLFNDGAFNGRKVKRLEKKIAELTEERDEAREIAETAKKLIGEYRAIKRKLDKLEQQQKLKK